MAITIAKGGTGIATVGGAYFSPTPTGIWVWRVWLCNTYDGDTPVHQRWKGSTVIWKLSLRKHLEIEIAMCALKTNADYPSID